MENEINLYTVYDSVTETAGPLFEQPNDQSAIRATVTMMIRSEMRPDQIDDYQLFCVGKINRKTMEIVSYPITEKGIDYESLFLRTMENK